MQKISEAALSKFPQSTAKRAGRALGLLALLLSFTGCNVFSAIDKPGNDAQYISAGRACVDKGDFGCAFDYYKRVSGDGMDAAYADMAFATLAAYGAEIGDFVWAFGDDVSAGTGITRLARKYAPRSGEPMRIGIYAAMTYAPKISNLELRGLVRFVTGMALVAELLAEDAGAGTELSASTLVRNPSACARIDQSQCFSSIACSKPDGRKLVSGNKFTDFSAATLQEISGTPTFHMMSGALAQIRLALTYELAMTGPLEGSTADFAQALLDPTYVAMDEFLPIDPSRSVDSPCFRYALLTNEVGYE